MAAPQCDSVAIENGGDDFIETPKVVNKVEAEPRPDFKELKSIEKERREILLRVSAYDMQSCVSAFVDMHIFFSNQFHSFPLTPMICCVILLSISPTIKTYLISTSGGTSILENPSFLVWNMPQGNCVGLSSLVYSRNLCRNPHLCQCCELHP